MKKNGGDREKDRGSFGKDDVVTAGYASANDAVHKAGSKRQDKRGSFSGIFKNKNKNVPPKSTSHDSRSSRVEGFSGGTDDNKNGADGGDDNKKGSGAGDDGNNDEGGGGGNGSKNKDKCNGGAGFGFHGSGYHGALKVFGAIVGRGDDAGAKRQRKPSRMKDFSGVTDDNKNGGDDGNNGSGGGDGDKKGSGGSDDVNNGEGGGGGSGSNNKDKSSGGAGFGIHGYGYHVPAPPLSFQLPLDHWSIKREKTASASEKKKDENSGGDEDDNEGGDGEKDSGWFGKDDVATAGYTSANDAVHNTGAKRQRKLGSFRS